MLKVNITEGKRDFTKIIQSLNKDEEVIITKRGKPVAAIVSYKEFKSFKRLSDWLEMLKIADKMKTKGVKARQLYEASRKELEKRWRLL
jgi:prevent-host-death family protein